MTGRDLKSAHTFERPMIVAPQKLEAPGAAATMTFKLPPRSYTVVQFGTS
jgi:hypothetical protein